MSVTTRAVYTPATETALAGAQADKDLYRELKRILEAEGCFKPARMAVFIKIALFILVELWCYLHLLTGPSWTLRIALLTLLGIAHAQCGFLAHDAVHGTLT